MPKSILLPSIIGNLLESYDFALYGFFASYIAPLFFPAQDAFLSLLATFAIFAVGLFVRPVGAALFAYFGDRFGRKKALLSSVLLMAASTTLMGLLPTYAQIGAVAAVLLVLCRIAQGISMGGEYIGSLVYMLEHAPEGRQGLHGSFALCGTFMGLLVGSGVSALLTLSLSPAHMQAWGWRLPFLAGFLLGILGMYLRSRMPETPHFQAAKTAIQLVPNPFLHALRQAPLKMCAVLGLNFLPGMGFYLLFVYLSSWMKLYLHVPLSTALTINTISMLCMVIALPCVGYFSDKRGQKPIMLAGVLGVLLFSYPLFVLLARADFLSMLLAHTALALLMCLIIAPFPALLVSLFPVPIRCSGISVPFNIGNALFGGTAPFIATYFIHTTGNLLFPSFYLILAAAVMFCVVLGMPKTHCVSRSKPSLLVV